MTVGEAFAQFAEKRILQKPKGPATYRQACVWLRPLWERSFPDLTNYELEAWYHDIPPKAMATRTLQQLSGCYRWWLHRRLPGLTVNPCQGIRPHKSKYRKAIIHLGEEMQRYLGGLALLSLKDQNYFEMCMGVSAREMEIARLRWTHLDLTLGHVRIWQSKTQTWKRLAIPPTPLAQLRQLYPARCCEWVYCRAHHGPWSHTDIHRQFEKVKAAANLRHLCVHDLRRSRISHVYAQSKDIKLCQEMAGHASPQQTWRYIVVEVSEEANAVNCTVDELMRQPNAALSVSSCSPRST